MELQEVADNGLVMLGCGKMGSAMLSGWLDGGLPASSVWVSDPAPSDWLRARGVHLNAELPAAPAIVLLAVKPQMMGDALPALAPLGGGKTLFITVAAGIGLARYEAILGSGTPIVRAMPNTPAAIKRGITAIVGNGSAGAAHMDMAAALLRAVGQVVTLQDEAQIDLVTGISGSGPAYVFHMIEALAAAGAQMGLPPALSMQLAKATVAGAGALAEPADVSPEQLRIDVTSPNGTTQKALEVLMDPDTGMAPLVLRAARAAADRARELANG
jgi:pyrroline-5-carboxylate reductase